MASVFQVLNGQFSVYTMDHRGTGRSNLLDCTASQATAPGSKNGMTVSIDELPQCLKDLNVQYGALSMNKVLVSYMK